MGDRGIRWVRNYTLHPPAFYDELAAYNAKHGEAPLYLVQGVYLPDESDVEEGRTLYTPAVDDAFTTELEEISAAVHGDLSRPKRPGHASGTWRTDVSEWIVSWIVGVAWDPDATHRTDKAARDAASTPGTSLASPGQPPATARGVSPPLRPHARRGRPRWRTPV